MCIDGNYAAEIPAADGHWQNWRKTGTWQVTTVEVLNSGALTNVQSIRAKNYAKCPFSYQLLPNQCCFLHMHTNSNSSRNRHIRLRIANIYPFLPRDAMHKRGLCRHAVSVCLCVCESVCLSRSQIMWKRINVSSKFFSPLGSQAILLFPYQTSWHYSDGNPPPPNGASNARGMKKRRFSTNISLYLRNDAR